jgi:hypothetical protein
MITRRFAPLILAALAQIPAAAHAGHSELQVPPADTFLLGGEQRAPMQVSGRNTGTTSVTILASTAADAPETMIATVLPGGSFSHSYAPGEIALIRNQSPTETARISVDFTGSAASLTMSYALPQKN